MNLKKIKGVCLCLLLFGSMTVNAQKLSFNNERTTLKKAFEKIESLSKYKFAYNSSQLDENRNVTLNQKNIDIDNKFIKPIVDGLVLSKVIADDNINNMFYGVLGTTNKKKKPYTEVYVFRGEKMLDFIKNQIEADTK